MYVTKWSRKSLCLQAGVTAEAKLEFASILFYSNGGYVSNEAEVEEAVRFAKNCYQAQSWAIEGTDVLTNLPSNKSCRAPATTQVFKNRFILVVVLHLFQS
jgi:hypothetical protein